MNKRKSLFRNKYVRIVATLLAISWMAMIFWFSNQEAAVSTVESRSVSYQIVDGTRILFGLSWDDEKVQNIALSIEGLVRKAAHMTEYAVLALFISIALDAWELNLLGIKAKLYLKRIYIVVGICALYACSDEYHQTFIMGRTGRVSDVIIDTIGSVLMMGFISFFVFRVGNKLIAEANNRK